MAPFDHGGLVLPPGPVTVELGFVTSRPEGLSGAVTPAPGAPVPSLSHVGLVSRGIRVALDGLAAGPLPAIEGLLDHLHDISVRVEAMPGEDLWVRFLPGLSATIPGDAMVTCEAHTTGPPDAPRLNRSLVVSVGGAGLSVRLPGSRWLRILASVAIRRASLAPDGAVELHGAPGTLDRAVGFGLRHASHHLSDLVRRHPQFARVRTFLSD